MMTHSMDKKTEACPTPLELLNLYYSDGESTGNSHNKLWQKMDSLLTWNNILEKGYQADLCPLLYFIITKALPRLENKNYLNVSLNKHVPGAILTKLEKHYHSSFIRNMILLDELKKISQLFDENGIQHIVLKGGFLSEYIYEDIACRPMADLDLLVKENELQKVDSILVELGYIISLNFDSNNHSFHSVYIKNKLKYKIIFEIHWKLAREIFYTSFPILDIWDKALPLNSGQYKYLNMAFPHSLAYLSYHLNRHGFSRLIWLLDIGIMLKKSFGSNNSAEVYRSANKSNVYVPLIFSIYTISNLFSTNSKWIKEFTKDISITHQLLYDNLFIFNQKAILNNKNSMMLINLLAWVSISGLTQKIKHLIFRLKDIKVLKNHRKLNLLG